VGSQREVDYGMCCRIAVDELLERSESLEGEQGKATMGEKRRGVWRRGSSP